MLRRLKTSSVLFASLGQSIRAIATLTFITTSPVFIGTSKADFNELILSSDGSLFGNQSSSPPLSLAVTPSN